MTIIKYAAIVVLIIAAVVAYQVFQPKLKECPDAIAGDVMPGGASSGAYYLKNGEARKISDYDTEWVKANCKVENKTVS